MPPQQQRPKAPKGLNENYGRELLELHTLGVDGGYTQKDVTEVARAFTGWSIANPRMGGGFRFMPQLHDDGEKIVLGHRIKSGGGEHDGEEVLDILANHPATARFIATKLARRFVSDNPPQPLVDRATSTFRETHGDLRAVMATILTSPEFLSADAYRAKVKSPFEFVVSAVRATGADVNDAQPLVRAMQQLGMPLYQCQPPTGYKDTADAWVNAGALVNRMNDALALASGRMPGVSIPDAPSPESVAGRQHVGHDTGDDCEGGHRPASPRPRARLAGISEATEIELEPDMISRRVFLKNGSFALVSLGFAPSFLARTAFAAAPARRSKRLIAIFQRGAVDGLSMVVPYGENEYYRARPTIADRAAGKRRRTRRSTSTASSASTRGWRRSSRCGIARELAIVHACGSPDSTRSHFDAQDYMETATPGVKSTEDGWLNRYLQAAARRSETSVPRRGARRRSCRACCRARRRRSR